MNLLKEIAYLLAKCWIPDIESNSQWIFHNITPGYDTRVHIELIKQEPIEVSNETMMDINYTVPEEALAGVETYSIP